MAFPGVLSIKARFCVSLFITSYLLTVSYEWIGRSSHLHYRLKFYISYFIKMIQVRWNIGNDMVWWMCTNLYTFVAVKHVGASVDVLKSLFWKIILRHKKQYLIYFIFLTKKALYYNRRRWCLDSRTSIICIKYELILFGIPIFYDFMKITIQE